MSADSNTEFTRATGLGLTVVLVHGTAAALADDEGVAWWQLGGKFQTWLKERGGPEWQVQPPLFKEPKIHPDGQYMFVQNRIFHWSGKNSEVARRQAGQQLAGELGELERKGTPYALIGHSHGGSVAWHAVMHLYGAQRKLNCLQAVVTLGTPFLRFGARTAWLRQFLLAAAAGMGMLFLSASWIEFGNQLPDLWNSGEYAGLALALSSAFGCGFALCLSTLMTLACLWSAWQEKRRCERDALLVEELGDRLRCIVLPTDEAINGLAVTVPVNTVSGTRSPKVYSGWITRITDWVLVDRMVRQAAGNDLRGVVLLEVGRTPAPEVRKFAEYPAACCDPIEARVEASAGKNWRALKHKLRERAEHPAQTGKVSELMVGLQVADFLTHCQYYDDEAIQHHILAHLLGECVPGEVIPVPALPLAKPSPERIRWAVTVMILAGLLMVGFLFSRTGEALLGHGVTKTVTRRAPFADAAGDPVTQLRYLRSLVAVGLSGDALRLLPDISQPEYRARATTMIRLMSTGKAEPDSARQATSGLSLEMKQVNPSALIAAFSRWPMEDSYLTGGSAWDPDDQFEDATAKEMVERSRTSDYPIDIKLAREFIGEAYVRYLAIKALKSRPANMARVAERLDQVPSEWRDLSQRLLIRAYAKWGRGDIALPYLRQYRREAEEKLASQEGAPGPYPKLSVAMQLLDLSDSFQWVSDETSANQLRRLGEQQLLDEGLTLQGTVGATLWANQLRLDQTELLMRDGTWADWKQTVSGMRKLAFEIWPVNDALLQQYLDTLLEDSEPKRLYELEALLGRTPEITSVAVRSSARKEIALDYLGLGRIRSALDISDTCLARDRLAVYSEILFVVAGRGQGDKSGATFRSRKRREWSNSPK